MSLLLISSERFADHVTPPGHPERPARAEVMDAVATRWARSGAEIASPRPASRAELERVHSSSYLDRLAATCGRATALDADTYTSPDSHEVALLAAGAAVQAVEHTLAGEGPALALVRPPGHHAEADRAMGFCLYNNVAVGAAHALARGVRKIALVDYDVHHGNGSQAAFYGDPRVLYVSIHQYPFYPGTGAATETGEGSGRGFTVNLPLAAGCTDDDYDYVVRTVALPVIEEFGPELVLVSAGFDAHERDPLGGMRMTERGYARITTRLRHLVERCCGGRFALVTEGGYDLEALAACLGRVIEVLGAATVELPDEREADERARVAVEAARRAHAPFWVSASR